MNNWSDKRGVSFSPFGDLNSAFENEPRDLYQDCCWVILECMMPLKPEKKYLSYFQVSLYSIQELDESKISEGAVQG